MRVNDAKVDDWSSFLGPASRAMLARAGIDTYAQLRALGAVEAYRRTKAVDPRASLNLLWALEGGLSGRHWRVVAREDRWRLLNALDAGESAGVDPLSSPD